MVKINIIITTLQHYTTFAQQKKKHYTRIQHENRRERNMRYYWLIRVSHYVFFLMNVVVFFASVMVCRISNGVLRLHRLFVMVVTGVSV